MSVQAVIQPHLDYLCLLDDMLRAYDRQTSSLSGQNGRPYSRRQGSKYGVRGKMIFDGRSETFTWDYICLVDTPDPSETLIPPDRMLALFQGADYQSRRCESVNVPCRCRCGVDSLDILYLGYVHGADSRSQDV